MPARAASAAMRSPSVMPPVFDRSGCQMRIAPSASAPLEIETRVVILARRQRHAGQARGGLVVAPGMRRERLLQPRDVMSLEARRDSTQDIEIVGGVGVDHERDLGTQRLAHCTDPRAVVIDAVAHAQLERAEAARMQRRGLLGQGRRRLETQGNAAGIAVDGALLGAEQRVERQPGMLALHVP